MSFIPYKSIPTLKNKVFDEIEKNKLFDEIEKNKVFDEIEKNKDYRSPSLFRGTVKLHGTHGDIVRYTDGSYHAQSKNKILTDDHDNADFKKFVFNNWSEINKLFDCVGKIYKNDIHSHIIIAGEWCGKGIQKHVAINDLPRMFVYFDIFIDNRRCDINLFRSIHNDTINVFNILQFTSYGIIIDNFLEMTTDELNIIECYVDEVENKCPVAAYFGVHGLGEGIVWSSKNIIFKTKGKLFFEVVCDNPRINKNKKNNTVSDVSVSESDNVIQTMVSQERLYQGLQYLIELEKDISTINTKLFIDWIINNIVNEETQYMSNYDPKNLKIFQQYAAKWYLAHIKSFET